MNEPENKALAVRGEEALPGRAVKVTLYEDRAEVVRAACAALSPGPQWVAVGGVTPLADDRSVRAKVAGDGVRVLAARVRRRVTAQNELGREEIEALEAQHRAALERLSQAERALERSGAAHERLGATLGEVGKALSQVPLGAHEGKLAGWRSAWHALEQSLDANLDQSAAAQFAVEVAREEEVRTRARLLQGQRLRPRAEAAIEVQVEAARACEVEVEVTYRTPCALWRPEHLVRLTEGGADQPGQLEVLTWATVWQATGEKWEEVEACFSTARPARAASAPLLSDDTLYSRKKTEQERKTVVVEARDQAIALAGAGQGASEAQEMPGVDDGGLPLSFRPGSKVTLPSDGEPLRVEIGRTRMEAKVARVLFPEVAAVTHLRASATLKQETPLLAGPMRVARGAGLVGRARMGFVAPGEPFEVGFGSDDGLRVRRAVEEKRDQTFALGTQKLERTVRLYLSNLSDQEKQMELTERIPVSEVAEVEIELKSAPGFARDDKDGFLRQRLSVPARATHELELKYEVRAKANVVLPF